MPILKIINLLDKKRKLIFLLFFIFSLFAMLLETISIGLLIPFVSTIVSEGTQSDFNKLFEFFNLETKTKKEILFFIAILILITQSIKTIFLTIYSFLEQKFLTTTRAEISNKLFQIYLNQPLQFYLNNNSSEFIRNIQDSDTIRMLLRNIILLMKECVLFFGLILFVIIFEPTGSGFVILALISIGYFFTRYINKKAKIWGKIRQQNMGLSFKIKNEAFKLIKEIKIYKKINFFVKKFIKLNTNIRYSEFRQNFFNSLPRLWLEWLLILIFSVLIFYYLATESSVEDIMVSLVIFAAVGIKLIPSLSRLISSLQLLSYYNSVVNTIHRLFKIKEKKYVKQKYLDINIKDLSLKNLTFFYEDKKNPILSKINFKFQKNKIYGITGGSGAGKTTLINILLGLLEPKKGGVYINGKLNILDQLDFWHKKIGYVQQNYSLIDDTIQNNIVFGQNTNEIDKKNFQYAIKNSRILDFIKFKKDIRYRRVGENGDNISGGQKQRVSLARALYNKPLVLILDEFTSSLDPELEEKIISEIKRFKKDKFIFIVSHKLSTLKVCDKLLKIDKRKLSLIK